MSNTIPENLDDNSLYLSLNTNDDTTKKNQILCDRVKLMALLESSDSKPNYDQVLQSLLHVNAPLQDKCHSLMIHSLLLKNCTERDKLPKLSAAFNILYRYGRNLLKDEDQRPQFWRAVKFSNSVFHTRVDSLEGCRHILCQFGYTQEIGGGLAFPENTSPHRDTVAELSTDLLIGKYEIDVYTKGQHPFPQYIEAHISTTACFQQELQNVTSPSQEERVSSNPAVPMPGPANANMTTQVPKPPPPGGVPLLGMMQGVGPHLLKRTSPDRGPPVALPKPMYAPASMGYESMEVCRVCESFVATRLCNCILCNQVPFCDNCFRCWHEVPPNVPTRNHSVAPAPASTNAAVARQDTCQLCGSKPNVFMHCPDCDTFHCNDCDDAWHRHAMRKNHVRRDVQVQELPPICDTQTNAGPAAPVPIIEHGMTPSKIVAPEPNQTSERRYSRENPLFPPRPSSTIAEHFGQPSAQVKSSVASKTEEWPKAAPVDPRMVTPAVAKAMFDQHKEEDMVPVRDTAPVRDRTNFFSQFLGSHNVTPFDASRIQTLRTLSPLQHPQPEDKNTYVVIRKDEIAGTKPPTMPKPDREPQKEEDQPFNSVPVSELHDNKTTPHTGMVSHSVKPVAPPRPNKQAKKIAVVSGGNYVNVNEIQPPTAAAVHVQPMALKPMVPPKPSQLPKPMFSSRPSVLDEMQGYDPEICAVMLEVELEKLESEIKGLQLGIEIFAKKKNSNNPESNRLKDRLKQKKDEFFVLCNEREKFGIGKYVPKFVTGLKPEPQFVDNKAQELPPKPAWPEKDVLPLSKVSLPVHNPPRIALKGLPMGKEEGDIRPSLKSPVIPLVELGSLEPFSFTEAPKPQDLKKHIPEIPQFQWECQLCTFHNSPGKNRCSMCETENVNPQYVDDHQELDTVGRMFDDLNLEKRPLVKGFLSKSMYELDTNKTKEKPFVDKFASQTLDRRFLQQEERAKLQNVRLKEGRDMIKHLKEIESTEYTLDQFEIAAKYCEDWMMTPFEWLQQYWDTFKENVISQAVVYGAKEQPNILENLTGKEIMDLLITCKDVDAAIEKCYKDRKEMVEDLKCTGKAEEDIVKIIGECSGYKNDVYNKVNESVIEDVLTVIWDDTEEERPLEQHEFQDYIQNNELDKEKRLRALLVHGRFNTCLEAEMVFEVLDDANIDVEQASFEDIVDAARTAEGDMEKCKSYLQQECEMCFTLFPMNKIRNLVHCQCKMCEGCLLENFKFAARDREAKHMSCPICEQPDLQNDEARADSHFQILDLILKNLLDDHSYELFQKKLINRHLVREPNFRWCAHCENGIIFNGEEGQLKMTCPGCHHSTCFSCKNKWEQQHEGVSCEQFRKWKFENDPEFQAAGLARHLQENGIDCPNCKFRYALARGGCMHFRCTQCGFEFCSGCYNAFKKGDSCGLLARCATSGLHCHHPRDCLYYLRDYDVPKLKKLLEENDIGYKSERPQQTDGDDARCSVLEQKETLDGLKDEHCGKPTNPDEAGLCEVHYKEYLVVLINSNHIDPIAIMDVEDLKRQLERLEKDVPNRRRKEPNDQYGKRLKEYVQENIPLQQIQQRVSMMSS